MNFMNFFGYGKLMNLMNNIRSNGGLKQAFLLYVRTDQMKSGTLVGEDKYGNKYYQNNYYPVGKNRWVIYSDKFGYDYDASQIPAEWYGWLHYKTDLLPHEDKSRPKYKWMIEENDNFSGTPKQYVPYSTTRRKIETWVPSKSK